MADCKIKRISTHFENLQSQIADVRQVMKHNTEAILERDHRLGELFARAEALEEQANVFVKNTTHVQKKMKRKSLKWTCWIFTGIAVISIAIINTILFC
jgi:type IV secretory pathway component VirB8